LPLVITLIATPMDVFGHVRFLIEVDERLRASTEDALDAANALDRLGVENALRFVEHVREWGFVEIEADERPARGRTQRAPKTGAAFSST
jgi:hypothetical protein